MKKKATIAVVALVLVLCCAMGGTLAWLVDSTIEVKNTFTYGDINIDLSESEDLDLKMIPGNDIKKDPKVEVVKDSEACWLFVKVEKSGTYDSYLEDYEIDAGWIELDGFDGVYYREVDADDAENGITYQVLAGKGNDDYSNGYVTVKNTVTKEMMNNIDGIADDEAAINDEVAARPTLTFTAYAVQKDNVNSAADAWAIANPTTAD